MFSYVFEPPKQLGGGLEVHEVAGESLPGHPAEAGHDQPDGHEDPAPAHGVEAALVFAAIAANTPHVVYDELDARSPIPMVSIVEATAEEAQRRGLKRVAILGTRFTMEGSFYPETCARYGIKVVAPQEKEREWIHQRYVGEMLKGDFREETRRGVIAVISGLRDEEKIDGVILGGTELTLLLPAPVIAGISALDTTELHVSAIVKRLRSGRQ